MRLCALLVMLAALLNGCSHLSRSDLVTLETSKDLASPAQKEPYTVTYGDILDISVWGDESMNRKVLVRPDGKISYPLAGDFSVVGLPVSEIQTRITEKIRDYMPDTPVTVQLADAKGNSVFVVGKVQRPGAYPLSGPMTPIQALAMAGGVTPFADSNDIVIIRVLPNGKQKSYPFNYDRIASGNTDQNIQLQPGDSLIVP